MFAPVVVIGRQLVTNLAKDYLNKRSDEMKPGGFKSVRFGPGLFVSKFGDQPIGQVNRDDAAAFVRKVSQLSVTVGKSEKVKGYGLDQLVRAITGTKILPQTQRRIVTQVGQFIDWVVYQGVSVAARPFAQRVDVLAKAQGMRSSMWDLGWPLVMASSVLRR